MREYVRLVLFGKKTFCSNEKFYKMAYVSYPNKSSIVTSLLTILL